MIYYLLFLFFFSKSTRTVGEGGVGKTLSMISSGLGEKAMTASKEQHDLISSPVSCAGAKTARESPDKEKIRYHT